MAEELGVPEPTLRTYLHAVQAEKVGNRLGVCDIAQLSAREMDVVKPLLEKNPDAALLCPTAITKRTNAPGCVLRGI